MNNLRRENEEVFYSTSNIVSIKAEDIVFLKKQAALNSRKRCRICVHPGATSSLHGMLIVHGIDAYVRPHRHLLKAESLHVIEGSALMLAFDEEGEITQTEELSDLQSGKSFYYRMPKGVFHSIIITSNWLVFYESTTGPFNKKMTENASWAPPDEDFSAVKSFLKKLKNEAVFFLESSQHIVS